MVPAPAHLSSPGDGDSTGISCAVKGGGEQQPLASRPSTSSPVGAEAGDGLPLVVMGDPVEVERHWHAQRGLQEPEQGVFILSADLGQLKHTDSNSVLSEHSKAVVLWGDRAVEGYTKGSGGG